LKKEKRPQRRVQHGGKQNKQDKVNRKETNEDKNDNEIYIIYGNFTSLSSLQI
jgi:hypothetical protein